MLQLLFANAERFREEQKDKEERERERERLSWDWREGKKFFRNLQRILSQLVNSTDVPRYKF